ncbi:MAG TPA: lysylphosphatidylglycerol synthase transmembrane domain-containing protein [Bryobacterales bacterium]|nr:lysylphosphatidylglycerol synthase transmembrane domain-containing protein [Bryobacterales bacterium]
MEETVLIGEQQSVRRRVLTLLVYVAAAAGLVWVLRGVSWKEFLDDLVFIDWRWVIPAVALDILSYVVQALRWNYVLRPLGAPSVFRSTQAIYVGLFTNEILPLRGGELVRSYLVSHWTRLGFSVVLCSVAIERLLDGLWLAIGFGVAALLVKLPSLIRDGAQALGIIVLGGVALLVIVLAEGLRVTHALERTRAGGRGLLAGILHFIDRLFEGLQTIGHSASLYWAAATSLLLLLTQILSLWTMMLGFGLNYSVWVAAAVLFILHLGTAIPNAPANIGSYQVSCVAGLMLFGVDKTTAAEFSVVMFAILTVPLLVLGLAALLLSDLSLQDIRRAASEHRKRHRAAPDAAARRR